MATISDATYGDVNLQQKDMLLALDLGQKKMGVPVPLGAAANEMLNACPRPRSRPPRFRHRLRGLPPLGRNVQMKTVSHQSSRCAEKLAALTEEDGLDQHASPVPHRPGKPPAPDKLLIGWDGPSPRRARHDKHRHPNCDEFFRRDSRQRLHLHRHTGREASSKRRRHFSRPPRPLARPSTTPAPKTSVLVWGWSGAGSLGSRRLRNSPRGLLIEAPDFQNANCPSNCLGRPANQKRNAAGNFAGRRENARRGKEAARLEARLWRPRGSRKTAHQRAAGRIF